ncbi:hypothetical protein [uncultured Tateyamaria sp.]|nr:hypothetical protein [uncultured Tateyamaria sp.]
MDRRNDQALRAFTAISERGVKRRTLSNGTGGTGQTHAARA